MSTVESSVLLVTTGAMLIYALYRWRILRDILAKHGKRPASLILGTSMLYNTRVARELIAELDDEEKIREVRTALKKADVATVMTFIIFFVLGFVFLSRR
jgi:uncharacterized membrane protein